MSKPAITELVAMAQAIESADFGKKGALYSRYAAQYNCTKKAVMDWLKPLKVNTKRKARSDKGSTALSKDEALLIATMVMESSRKSGKRLYGVAQAVQVLRNNNMLRAERIDEASGEVKPMSTTAIERAMDNYGLHPEQLNRPAPAQQLRSLHPNHVWQIDPSLCVLYYLPKGGMQVMADNVFYKNKPENVKKIERERVWRYVITDHTTGWVYVEYVFGAESGENLSNIFINAIQQRGPKDPVHGVPNMVMVDPGSANTGAVFKNLCKALGVRLQVNKPGNPRAKGQVEGMNNIIERQFEGGLKFTEVSSIDQLNDYAWAWMRMFNSQNIHRRHGKTRFEAWMSISAEQLIKAPDIETCRALTHERSEERKIDAHMQISWKANKYDVAHIPNLSNGDKIEVARNPWKPNCIRVITENEAGDAIFYEAEMVTEDEWGFNDEGAVIGENYKPHKDTATVKAQKLIEQIAMDANTEAESQGKRKAKTLPFGGKVNPYIEVEQAEATGPSYLEKRGTDSPVKPVTTVSKPFNIVQAAKALKGKMGNDWQPAFTATLKAKYKNGEVPQEDIEMLSESLLKPAPMLKVVGK